MNVPEDQNPDNNSITKKVGNFTSEAVNLSGYRIEDDSHSSSADRGFIKFSSANPEDVTLINNYQPDYNATLIQTGEYADGYWYYYSLDEVTFFPWTVPIAFAKLSTKTYEVEAEVIYETDVDVPRDMTYDHSTDVMYGIFIDNLVTIDLITSELTTVGSFNLPGGSRMVAIACNLTGEIYAVDGYGDFYSVNKTTGAATFINATGIRNDYLQCMTFDHNTGRLFWALREFDDYNSMPRVGKLIEIEPSSGITLDLGVLGGNAQVIGLHPTPLSVEYFTITAIAHSGGTIDPEGEIVVEYGSDLTFTITPNYDFEIDKVEVNGAVVTLDGNTYKMQNITVDATIEAYFERVGIFIDKGSVINVLCHNKVVTIINKDLIPVKQMDIVDAFGRIVWKGEINSERTEINLSNFAAGVYAVRIITENNQQIVTKINIQ